MTKCDGCGKEAGNLFCGHCRTIVEKKAAKVKIGALTPLLYWDAEHKVYVMACYCYGCPMNKQGVCSSTHQTLLSLKNLMHEFDGDNIIRQVCG